jgi:molybdenum cofactor cytidylyltransferase
MTVAAIILAAGAGRRMGRPKALLKLESGPPSSAGPPTFLERAVAICREGGCHPIQVVILPDAELVALVRSLPVQISVNPDPERGMFSSVKIGLEEAMSERVQGVVIHPVDHPHVLGSTVAAVIAALAEDDAWVVPCREGRPGHPIGLGHRVARALLNVSDALTLRAALEQVGARRVDVDVDDPGILENVNTPNSH